MKERPLLFSGPMVKALLAGTKTQTRRLAKIPTGWSIPPAKVEGGYLNRYGNHGEERIACPYGGPGSTLWVREEHYRFGHWEPVEGVKTKGGRQKWRFLADRADCIFEPPTAEYNEPTSYRVSRGIKEPAKPQWYKRLARFMPRALSRITLEIVSVRVERLQDISDDDAKAEGVGSHNMGLYHQAAMLPMPASWYKLPEEKRWTEKWHPEGCPEMIANSTMRNFINIWCNINGPGSWAKNPFVWVIEFRRVQA